MDRPPTDIRHPDGALITHENQCYIGMTEEQERLARSIFTDLPEDELPLLREDRGGWFYYRKLSLRADTRPAIHDNDFW
ncbi:hypothetical protein [Serratia silvae]|uniref:Uncharacterized protein n=1 Tax=Serratia silvae TaxID=2824122 RepID=A0ABT0KHB7_9GAMM|nr:hypothetical protein [Serratia silvae]MCL1031332.1 hypothetical protein [Serratia silvae]